MDDSGRLKEGPQEDEVNDGGEILNCNEESERCKTETKINEIEILWLTFNYYEKDEEEYVAIWFQ